MILRCVIWWKGAWGAGPGVDERRLGPAKTATAEREWQLDAIQGWQRVSVGRWKERLKDLK